MSKENELTDEDIKALIRQNKVYSKMIGRRSIGLHFTTAAQLSMATEVVMNDERTIADQREAMEALWTVVCCGSDAKIYNAVNESNTLNEFCKKIKEHKDEH